LIKFCTAYANTDYVSFHHDNLAYFELFINSDGTITGEEVEYEESTLDLAMIHGWLLWVAWGAFGFI